MSINKRLICLFFGLPFSWAFAALPGAQVITNNTPKFVSLAKNLGHENPLATIEVSVWLHPHNRNELDSLTKELYDPASPNYRHWLDRADFKARFAPTAAEAKIVQEFLTTRKLQVVTVDSNNFFVRARGTVADVQTAFHVQLDKFEANGKTIRANTGDPSIEGPAAALVLAVSGLDTMEFSHPLISQSSLVKRKTRPPSGPIAARASEATFFTSQCFTGPKTETFSDLGSYPIATYTGNGYTDSALGCGYSPAEIRTAYNLNGLYKEGMDGSGQTIVIVDWCGSPTIQADANAFSARFGLPGLTSKNFSIVNYPAPSTCAAPDAEINLDVEWSHAIAPGADIVLLVPPSAYYQDIFSALLYAIENNLGNVISNSYGSGESYTSPSYVTVGNFVVEAAAALGISANFSTGDDGDYTYDDPQNIPATVIFPAGSPYATAVGGVSLALTPSNEIAFQTGWGTNETSVVQGGYPPFDPPLNYGFNFGSGGGPSAVFAKPAYQSKLKGSWRQLPDVSWLGDPFTGAIIAISEPFTSPELQYEVYGGTSLACPMFSALWAIANQEAGSSLGQAAPYMYYMPKGTIIDIVPYSSTTNVTGKVKESDTLTNSYSAAYLAAPLEKTTKFYSALWDYPLYQDTTYILTFGTDTGLTTAVGWDNVTGVGVPNGQAFADYFKP